MHVDYGYRNGLGWAVPTPPSPFPAPTWTAPTPPSPFPAPTWTAPTPPSPFAPSTFNPLGPGPIAPPTPPSPFVKTKARPATPRVFTTPKPGPVPILPTPYIPSPVPQYIWPFPSDPIGEFYVRPGTFGGLGLDIQPVDVTPAINLDTGLFTGPSVQPVTVTPAINLDTGLFGPSVMPQPISPIDLSTLTPTIPSITPIPTPALAFQTPSAPANPAPSAPANQASGAGSNWFTQDVLPVLGLAAQAYVATQTHQVPGITPGITPGVPVGVGPGGALTPAQIATMTPAQQAAYAAMYPGAGAGGLNIASMFGGTTGLLLMGGSVLLFVMLMRKK